MGQLYDADLTPSRRLDGMLLRVRQRFAALLAHAPASTKNQAAPGSTFDSLAAVTGRAGVVAQPRPRSIARTGMSELFVFIAGQPGASRAVVDPHSSDGRIHVDAAKDPAERRLEGAWETMRA